MPVAARSTRQAILGLLKTEGALDAARLARRLRLTPMGVRQHLYALKSEGRVSSEERRGPIGRPAKYWQLTRKADVLFPGAYAELNSALIDAVQDAFGPAGIATVLDRLRAREEIQYARRLSLSSSLRTRLRELAKIRTDAGYMAKVLPEGRERFLLVEHHCPIAAAAAACQGLCGSEITLFRSTLGPGVSVERTEHILAGDRRCAYRVEKAAKVAATPADRTEAGVVLLEHGYGCLVPATQPVPAR